MAEPLGQPFPGVPSVPENHGYRLLFLFAPIAEAPEFLHPADHPGYAIRLRISEEQGKPRHVFRQPQLPQLMIADETPVKLGAQHRRSGIPHLLLHPGIHYPRIEAVHPDIVPLQLRRQDPGQVIEPRLRHRIRPERGEGNLRQPRRDVDYLAAPLPDHEGHDPSRQKDGGGQVNGKRVAPFRFRYLVTRFHGTDYCRIVHQDIDPAEGLHGGLHRPSDIFGIGQVCFEGHDRAPLADDNGGGFFQLTSRGRAALSGIEQADSIAIDPHKGLSVPFGVGALLVRDESHLIDANQGRGAYLREEDHFSGIRDIASLGPELSRPFRALQIWLPLHLHGVAPFREALDSSLDLAEYAHLRLVDIEGLEVPWKPDLSVVAFRFEDDAIGRLALDTINKERVVHLSPTTIDGRFVLRFAILNRRTTRDHLDHAIDMIEKTLVG